MLPVQDGSVYNPSGIPKSYGPAAPVAEIPKSTPVPAEAPKPLDTETKTVVDESKSLDRYEPSPEAQRYSETLNINGDNYVENPNAPTGSDERPIEVDISSGVIQTANQAAADKETQKVTATQFAQAESPAQQAAAQAVAATASPAESPALQAQQSQAVEASSQATEPVATASALSSVEDAAAQTRDSQSQTEPQVDRDTTTQNPPSEDREPVEREPVDREPVDREPVDREPVDREPVDREPVDREPATSPSQEAQGVREDSPVVEAAQARQDQPQVQANPSLEDTLSTQEEQAAQSPSDATQEVQQQSADFLAQAQEAQVVSDLRTQASREDNSTIVSPSEFVYNEVDMADLRSSLQENDVGELDSLVSDLNNPNRALVTPVHTEDWFTDALAFDYGGRYTNSGPTGLYGNRDTEANYTLEPSAPAAQELEIQEPLTPEEAPTPTQALEEQAQEQSLQPDAQEEAPSQAVLDNPENTSTTQGQSEVDVNDTQLTEVVLAE